MMKLFLFCILMIFNLAHANDKISLRAQLEALIAKDKGYEHAILIMPHNFYSFKNIELVDYKYIPRSKKIMITLKDLQGNIHPLTAKFDEAILAPTSVHNIIKGSKIEESELTMVKFPKSNNMKNAVESKELIIGNTAKKTLVAGKFINIHDTAKSTFLSKGKNVKMLYTGHNISIESRGITLEHGAINDFIKVRNSDSGKSILAKIVAEDTVIVGVR